MEVLMYEIHRLWDGYLYYLDRADPRVEKWLLMSNYWPSIALTVMYLLAVYATVKFMENRKPFSCYWAMLAYNVTLVVLNFHIWFQLITATTRRRYSYSCQPVDYSDNPDEISIAKALWWFYISKLVEFFDTILFALRKKNSQITFLHVYHHATMFPIWWIGIKWVAGGQSFFGAMINSFVHVIMYTYYCLSALGPRAQPYLWWKKYLTRLQLLQFVLGLSHSAQSIYFQCDFPLWMQWALIIYGSTILVLFVNFYVRAYVRKTPFRLETRHKWCGKLAASGCGGGNGGSSGSATATAATATTTTDGNGCISYDPHRHLHNHHHHQQQHHHHHGDGVCCGGDDISANGGVMMVNGVVGSDASKIQRVESHGKQQQQQLKKKKKNDRLKKIN